MNISDVISNVHVYGLEDALRGSRYPMATDLSNVSSDIDPMRIKLAQCGLGEGHDNFLNGVLVQFDLDKAYISYVDPRMIEIMKEKVNEYNQLLSEDTTNPVLKEKYLEILYSNPAGFRLTAKMTTNYRQLKTIYKQRRNHRLPEWQAFCDWVLTLPHAELITTDAQK